MTEPSASSRKSTNVRISALGAALGAASLLSPPFASWMLERLFLSTRRQRVPERELSWLRSATPLRFASRGRELAAWVWESDGPTILLVHGWEGRGAQLGAFAAPLQERGFRVVTFDAPGHGASTGARSSLIEMAEAVRDADWRLGPFRGVVAHSAGAAAVSLALHLGARAGRLFYLAPPADLSEFLMRAGDSLGLPGPVVESTRQRIEKRFGLRWEEIAHTRLARGIRAPLLVVHDADDGEIELENSRRLVSSWPGSRLRITSGLGHRRILRDPSVIESAVEFLTGEEPYEATPRSSSDVITAASSEASTTRSFPSSFARYSARSAAE